MANFTLIEAMAKTAELVYKKVKTLLDNKVDNDGNKVLSTNDYTNADKTKLGEIASGAEVNQNAFSNIKVGSTTIAADSKTDTLTFSAGNNMIIEANASNDTITFKSQAETKGDSRFVHEYSDKTCTIAADPISDSQGRYGGAGLHFGSCSSGILPALNTSTGGYMKGIGGKINLGSATYRFNCVSMTNISYASDKKLKTDIKGIRDILDDDTLEAIFDGTEIVNYMWNYDNNEYEASNANKYRRRHHFGIIAQQVEKLIHDAGLTNFDTTIVSAEFFLNNTTGRYITAGWQPNYVKDDITYDYSENVYNYKHGLNYRYYNEILEKDIAQFVDDEPAMKDRRQLGYIMVEDNSKMSELHDDVPDIVVNGIKLVDKEGNYTNLEFDVSNSVPYYGSSGKACTDAEQNPDTGAVTIHFANGGSGQNKTYLLKLKDIYDLDMYEKILIDVDYIGEYKLYLMPEAHYTTANVYAYETIGNELIYNYTVDYREYTMLALAALQNYKKKSADMIESLAERIKVLEDRLGGGE